MQGKHRPPILLLLVQNVALLSKNMAPTMLTVTLRFSGKRIVYQDGLHLAGKAADLNMDGHASK
jgi:hypothetical protein